MLPRTLTIFPTVQFFNQSVLCIEVLHCFETARHLLFMLPSIIIYSLMLRYFRKDELEKLLYVFGHFIPSSGFSFCAATFEASTYFIKSLARLHSCQVY